MRKILDGYKSWRRGKTEEQIEEESPDYLMTLSGSDSKAYEEEENSEFEYITVIVPKGTCHSCLGRRSDAELGGDVPCAACEGTGWRREYRDGRS